MSHKDKNTLVGGGPDATGHNLRSPRDAKPEDFEIISAAEAGRKRFPGHGQLGDTAAENAELMNEIPQPFSGSAPVSPKPGLKEEGGESEAPHTGKTKD